VFENDQNAEENIWNKIHGIKSAWRKLGRQTDRQQTDTDR
jgi:hypothetical protein